MREQMSRQMDLADFLQNEVDHSSIRKVAKRIGIAPTTVTSIAKRKRQRMPDVDTLRAIADAYGFTLPVVVEMAGAALGDTERYTKFARELELHPWLTEKWDELTRMTQDEFREAMDYLEWRKRHPDARGSNGHRSNP